MKNQQPDWITRPDVLIVGSGPVGCTFARKLVLNDDGTPRGIKVLMIDAGDFLSARPGEHQKNAFLYQRNINLFTGIIKGHLHTLSVPVDTRPVVTLDPGAAQFDKPFVSNNQNPHQDAHLNLGASAASYCVGGMATHWTCACPRLHKSERDSRLEISDAEWTQLYDQSEELLNVYPRVNKPNEHPFQHSLRHQVVLEILKESYPSLKGEAAPRALPLACERIKIRNGQTGREEPSEFVHWSAADTVLGPLADPEQDLSDYFYLLPQHRCNRVVLNRDKTSIAYAEIRDLMRKETKRITAGRYIVAAGAVLTPQILFNSGIRPDDEGGETQFYLPALGRNLAEQPMAFCQIVLSQDNLGRFRRRQQGGLDGRSPFQSVTLAGDPIPIPVTDPEPQATIPVSDKRPWHCQIHRDAFSYGELAPNVDGRLIVDLRWFGITEQHSENRVRFYDDVHDVYGMPQPTFEYKLRSMRERNQQHEMMEDMLYAAGKLGGFLPGSEPQFMTPGLALHVHGTIRMGRTAEESVIDTHSKVHGIDNLYLGGNGVLSKGEAANPTLTSVAMAIRASDTIVKQMSRQEIAVEV